MFYIKKSDKELLNRLEKKLELLHNLQKDVILQKRNLSNTLDKLNDEIVKTKEILNSLGHHREINPRTGKKRFIWF